MGTKICKHCRQEIKGRIDKKFCDNYCRSAFYNQMHREFQREIGKTNSILKKNRQILAKLFQDKKMEITPMNSSKFLDLGFNFHFQTHFKELESGKICICCYDYGLIPEGNGDFTIIHLN